MHSIEICAGAGGQAIGLEMAGFQHIALVENDPNACQTLRSNRPSWNVVECDVRSFSALDFKGIALLSGGVPCPPFSIAGNRLGRNDERDLFPEVIRLVDECDPKVVMIENVKGILDDKFNDYRNSIINYMEIRGYCCLWKTVNSKDFGVSQNRVRSVLIALKQKYAQHFIWPVNKMTPLTVGDLLYSEMSANGWSASGEWALQANSIAPTIVGGSKKHGGADLGPTRTKRAWSKMGIDPNGGYRSNRQRKLFPDDRS